MVAEIGIMIGIYIVTRMLSYLTRSKEMHESIIVKVFAVITILVTIIVVADLFLRGTSSTLQ